MPQGSTAAYQIHRHLLKHQEKPAYSRRRPTKKSHIFVNLRRTKDLQKYVKSLNRLEYNNILTRFFGKVKAIFIKKYTKNKVCLYCTVLHIRLIALCLDQERRVTVHSSLKRLRLEA